MSNLKEEAARNWEQLFSQFKNQKGDVVICMMHKQTKKLIYFDVELNRLLSKQESLLYRVDVTGKYNFSPLTGTPS